MCAFSRKDRHDARALYGWMAPGDGPKVSRALLYKSGLDISGARKRTHRAGLG